MRWTDLESHPYHLRHKPDLHVETQGSVGAKNILSPQAIADADIVILATDIEVNTDRFICKRFVEINQGKISVTSQKGVGTTFKVLLPSAQEVHLILHN